MERTIPRLVLAAAETFGERCAIEDGDVSISFAQLAERGLRAAGAFCAAGLEPGDRVGIWAPNFHEWIVGAIGAQMAGGVLVTLNTRFKGVEAGYVLRKSGARVLLSVGEFLGTRYIDQLDRESLPDLTTVVALRGAQDAAQSWDDFLASTTDAHIAQARDRALAVGPDDLSDLLFTSGTTGQPKGVMTSHGQNLRAFEAWTEVVGLREGDRYLIVEPVLPLDGIQGGLVGSCLMRGATVDSSRGVQRRRDP